MANQGKKVFSQQLLLSFYYTFPSERKKKCNKNAKERLDLVFGKIKPQQSLINDLA